MIALSIKDLFRLRGIRQPVKAMRKAGISHYVAHAYLKGKKQRMVVEHLEILCKLLRCTPNELFSWEPDNQAEDFPENPLQAIRKKERMDLNEVLKGMSVEEIERRFGEGG